MTESVQTIENLALNITKEVRVQAIKRPTLMEITGPLFASYPLLSNVQYRLSESDGETMVTFRHTSLASSRKSKRKMWPRDGRTYSSVPANARRLLRREQPRAVARTDRAR
jgi:hypothetical protein